VSSLKQWWQCRVPGSPVASQPGAGQPGYFLARWIFLRLLGVVYLAAFLSLWVQILGLIGSRGILPAREYLAAIAERVGPERFYLVPTVCWLDAGDRALHTLCLAGIVFSGLLIAGVAPVLVSFLLWVAYLSLAVAGQQFFHYQWDALLHEVGFLAVFFAPLGVWPRLGREGAPSGPVLFLLRWLLFRLVFASGLVKLLSGDPTWLNLTALDFHYQTQPLPTWTSWYMHLLPDWFQKASVVVVFVAELVVPLAIFGPRRLRHWACLGIVGLQFLIAATGNYGFFNFLTVVLCVPLLDDGLFPARWRARLARAGESGAPELGRSWPGWVIFPMAGLVLALSAVPFVSGTGIVSSWPRWFVRAYDAVGALRTVNHYGLFAIMTTRRPEIIVEGSDDGETWKPYEFKWKPGNVARRPAFTGLHLPRLDWQMWFAALDGYQRSPWFAHFLERLLEGSPDVVALLEQNPFPERPPRYLRAVLYDYRFTDAETRAQTGAWWSRQRLGLFCPVARKPDEESLPEQRLKAPHGQPRQAVVAADVLPEAKLSMIRSRRLTGARSSGGFKPGCR
jgi:hypothetical protein